ncbi:MAG: hypothetical protein HYY13_01100 [Nitrospirae bacterium]|nr:hypothetical protein [Nitrospirota bacterium]
MTTAPPPKRKKLGELLLEAKLIDDFQLRSALAHQKKWGGRLGANLIGLGFITERQLLDYLAGKFGLEIVNVLGTKLDSNALDKVPKDLAAKHCMIPVRIEQQGPVSYLVLAMSDPTNLTAVDDVRFRTGMNVRPVLAGETQLMKAIQAAYGIAVLDDRSIMPEEPIRHQAAGAPRSGEDFVIYGMKTTQEKEIKGLTGEAQPLIRALIEILIEKKILTEAEINQKLAVPPKRFTTP